MILVITNDNRDLEVVGYWIDVYYWNYWENWGIVIELPFFTTIYHLIPLGEMVAVVLVWIGREVNIS
jgi:hypothetical protein